MTKRKVNYEDIDEDEVSETKISKTKKYYSRTKNEQTLIKPNIFVDPPIQLTRLFDNKEICVINGNDELPKERIEEILLQHRAKVVQNPLKENYCVIIGNVKTVNILFVIYFNLIIIKRLLKDLRIFCILTLF